LGALLTVASGWFLSSRLSRLPERFLATAIVAIAQIVVTLLIAGVVLRSLSRTRSWF
jgi:hypothetical protein